MPYWLKAVIFYVVTLLLLRLAGRRAISRKTPIEVVVMIALGTLLVHPLKSHNVLASLYGGLLLISGLILLSSLQIRFPWLRRWVTGEPILLIDEGVLLPQNLKKARMTIDELNMRLRLNKIETITKVKTATVEVSGDLGIELYPKHSSATKQDIQEIKQILNLIATQLNIETSLVAQPSKNNEQNVFNNISEIQRKDPLG